MRLRDILQTKAQKQNKGFGNELFWQHFDSATTENQFKVAKKIVLRPDEVAVIQEFLREYKYPGHAVDPDWNQIYYLVWLLLVDGSTTSQKAARVFTDQLEESWRAIVQSNAKKFGTDLGIKVVDPIVVETLKKIGVSSSGPNWSRRILISQGEPSKTLAPLPNTYLVTIDVQPSLIDHSWSVSIKHPTLGRASWNSGKDGNGVHITQNDLHAPDVKSFATLPAWFRECAEVFKVNFDIDLALVVGNGRVLKDEKDKWVKWLS